MTQDSINRIVDAILSLREVIEKDAMKPPFNLERVIAMDKALNILILMRYEAVEKKWNDLDELEKKILNIETD